MVDRVKTQRVADQRELNDTQAALQKLTDQLNQGALSLEQLPFFISSTNQIAWVGAGNLLIQPLLVVTEKSILSKAIWASTNALAADAVNYRTFALDLYRGGSKVSSMASKGTNAAGISVTIPYPLDLATQESDRTLQVDDVIILVLDGGGSKPALNNGVMTLYFEKSN